MVAAGCGGTWQVGERLSVSLMAVHVLSGKVGKVITAELPLRLKYGAYGDSKVEGGVAKCGGD